MEEVKEVLVEEVNTSTSNQRKKDVFIKTLKENFVDNLERVLDSIEGYKVEVSNIKLRLLQSYNIQNPITDLKERSIFFNKEYTDNGELKRRRILNRIKEVLLQSSTHIGQYEECLNTDKKVQKTLAPKVRGFASSFDDMASLLDSTIGENEWDVIGSKIYIHFPGFYIRNNSAKTFIKDLYVIINFNENNCFHISLQGQRATLSPIEYAKSYSHSHLSNGNFSRGTFCLGSGPIAQTLGILNSGEYSSDIFQLFLYQINDYLQWESLDGGPYRKISYLYANTKVKYDKNFYYSSIFKDFIRKKVKYSIAVSNNGIQVHIDEKDLKDKMYLDLSQQVIKFEGSYYRGSFIEELPHSFTPHFLFTFNDKEINTKVELTKAKYEYETTVHPRIIWYIKERLTSIITKKSKIARNSNGSGSSSSNEEGVDVETMVYNF